MKTAQIIGLQSRDKLGILKAFSITFDPKSNRVVAFKGASGEGKTTAMDALKTCVIGQKNLQDKNIRGALDIEAQILDGDHKLFVGFKPDGNGSYESYLYERDANGKKKNNPTIEGVKCTPSAWQKMMANELTWNYSGFTSKNPSEHKNTLLKLFQSHLGKVGVIFDKKSNAYNGSILDKLDKAIEARSYADMKRKEVGGIADALKDKYGIDVSRPATLPSRQNAINADERIANINKALGNLEADKKARLNDIKLQASELEKEAMLFNDKMESLNEKATEWDTKTVQINDSLNELKLLCNDFCELNITPIEFPARPEFHSLVSFEKGKIDSYTGDNKDGFLFVETRKKLMEDYISINNEPISDEKYKKDLECIAAEKEEIEASNKICDAVDSFLEWQEKEVIVKDLKKEYVKLLTSIDVGVDGMKIFPEDDNIFMKYNGCHDPKYFHNEKGEYRKLNEYSGSQLPMIVLQLQAKLLEGRSRSLRYIFIDDIPIDKKTQAYIHEMCDKLNLWVFVNINGDFEAKSLENGEVLFEGGEMLASNASAINEPDNRLEEKEEGFEGGEMLASNASAINEPDNRLEEKEEGFDLF